MPQPPDHGVLVKTLCDIPIYVNAVTGRFYATYFDGVLTERHESGKLETLEDAIVRFNTPQGRLVVYKRPNPQSFLPRAFDYVDRPKVYFLNEATQIVITGFAVNRDNHTGTGVYFWADGRLAKNDVSYVQADTAQVEAWNALVEEWLKAVDAFYERFKAAAAAFPPLTPDAVKQALAEQQRAQGLPTPKEALTALRSTRREVTA